MINSTEKTGEGARQRGHKAREDRDVTSYHRAGDWVCAVLHTTFSRMKVNKAIFERHDDIIQVAG